MSRIRDIANILSASTDMATDAEVTSSIASHAAAADPHSVYLKESEFNAAGKNVVINGGFDFWQRGTSFANSASLLAYTADRWYQARNATGMTISRQTTGDATNLPFIQYCTRVARDSGNTSTEIIRIVQSIETVNSIRFVGQTVTLSFYARKGSNYSDAASVVIAQVLTGTGTDQNINTITGPSYPISAAPTLTTTWQKFSYTGTISSSATQLHILFYGTPTGTAGAADYFEVTGIQLELGSNATAFSRAGGTIQGELAACQRYYWKAITAITLNGIPAVGFAIGQSTTTANAWVRFPVTMRGNGPSSIDVANPRLYSSAQFNPTAVTLANATPDESQLSITVSGGGLVQNQVYNFGHDNGAGSYVAFSAEL